MKAVVILLLFCVSVWLPFKCEGFSWNQFVKQRLDRNNVVKSSKCERLAESGNCWFYDCYNQIERACIDQGKWEWTTHSVEAWCFNTLFMTYQGKFSGTARRYLTRVSQCQTKRMFGVMPLKNEFELSIFCSLLGDQSTYAISGIDQGDIKPDDCYWQDGLFCDVIGNADDAANLLDSIYGEDDGAVDRMKRSQDIHIQVLARFCPQEDLDIFKQSYKSPLPDYYLPYGLDEKK